MAMKHCPVCGEKYSDTYKRCPFCEEDEALRRGGQIRRGGRRAARRGQPSMLSPILVVLLLVLAALLVYLLFGEQIKDKLSGGAEDGLPVEDMVPDHGGQTGAPPADDAGTMPEDDVSARPADDGDTVSGEDTETPETPEDSAPAETDDVPTPPADVSALPQTLTVAYMNSPRTEFTMTLGDAPIPLTATGSTGTCAWSSDDEGVASVDSLGRVTAVSAGRATITVTDGVGRGTCVVIVRSGDSSPSGGSAQTSDSGSGSSGQPAATGGLNTGAGKVINAGNGVFVRSGPGTGNEAVATLSNGAEVKIVRAAENNWYEITFSGPGGVETTGYMRGDFLSN